MSRLKFQPETHTAPNSRARAGVFHTLHGAVETPVFMPVGTQATVKAQTVENLKEVGSRVLLANTYHLLLRPGPEVFRKLGGIHRFMNWDGPILTDSGGFQIFSLPNSREMNEDGALFQSYVDQRTHLLSPETSIEMQKAIGSDIMMVLDQCIPSTAEQKVAEAAMHLTHRWARRSLEARGDSPQALFGIVQGACYPELRKASAEFLTRMPFDGFAVGGLAVGEGLEVRNRILDATTALLPPDLPRYLMGVGTPLDILEAVHRGMDMFDCILPSQFARRGAAFTSQGKLQLRRTVYRLSEDRLDPACECMTCGKYSRAYLHHLIKCEEILGWQLLTTHNLTFYHKLMKEIRQAIRRGTFSEFYESRRLELARTDEENPARPPKNRKIRKLRRLQLGDYEVHSTETPEGGFSSIRQISSGEIMHSVTRPEEEAEQLYIRQSGLPDKVLTESLVIWDVGLGAASNAMAAVKCFEHSWRNRKTAAPESPNQKILLISFEKDLDPLTLAARHPSRFPHLRHAAPHALLSDGRWVHESGQLEWTLIQGDFLATCETAPAPNIVFYDPFSTKTDSALWTWDLFSRLFRHFQGTSSTALFTYTNSTAVRASLLAAGFFVGKGRGAGPKTETTTACTRREDASRTAPLLDQDWLQRWERSGAHFPSTLISPEEKNRFESLVRGHPQWR